MPTDPVPITFARRKGPSLAVLALVCVATTGCVTARVEPGGVCNRVGVLAATCPPGSVPRDHAARAMAVPSAQTVSAPQPVQTAVLPAPDGSPMVAVATRAGTPATTAAVVVEPVANPDRLVVQVSPETPREVSRTERSVTTTLAALLSRTLADHPEIGMARARTRETVEAVRAARSGMLPQVDARFSFGQGTPIQPENDNGTVEPGSSMANQRTGSLSLRQTIFDFGATRNDILRNRNLAEAERLRLLDRMDEVALRTVSAYLKVLEQRELMALATENVESHRRIAELVRANQREGNSTVADVSRVSARQVEAQTQRTNLDNELQNALDQLRRLTKMEPGRLVRPPTFSARLPTDSEAAIAEMRRSSPRIRALALGSDAIRNEIAAQRANSMPRVGFELEGSVRDYMSPVSRSETDIRGMVVVRHRLWDGGQRRAQINMAEARLTENQFRQRNEAEELEANVRQAYRAITSARAKLSSLSSGVTSSREVRRLYEEQFKAGRRTLFELLDAQQSFYQARREQIVNQFEELRSTHGVLRAMGRLAETILMDPRQ